MSKSNYESTQNVLETQQKQQQLEKVPKINVKQKDNDISEREIKKVNNNKNATRRRREIKNSSNSKSSSSNSKRNKSQNNAKTSESAAMPKNSTQKQQQKQQQPTTSSKTEFEQISKESTSTTTSSSSTTTTHTKTATATKSSNASTSTQLSPIPPSTATQFSVQRSDTDGLRMRISAIRPNLTNTTLTSNPNKRKEELSNAALKTLNSKRKASINSSLIVGSGSGGGGGGGAGVDRTNNNTLKVKISNKFCSPQPTKTKTTTTTTTAEESKVSVGLTPSPSQIEQEQSRTTTTAAMEKNSSPCTVTSSTNIHSTNVAANPLVSSTMSTMLLPQIAACLSDATESGLSEATTTTVAAACGNEKAAKRVKLKRKKAQSKSNETKRSLKKSRQQILKSAAFSSDTDGDDDNHDKVGNENRLKPVLQRAPRLLLTAISSKSNLPQIRPPNAAAGATSTTMSTGVGSDNIGLSSSDNELPDLVNAAIKRVESDADETVPIVGLIRRSKTRHLQQYQSTLLQDFMEKTQMLGQKNALTATTTAAAAATSLPAFPAVTTTTTSKFSATEQQLDSVASSGSGEHSSKKRRGRPKKSAAPLNIGGDLLLDDLAKPLVISTTSTAAANINESGDSGVISTTSTTQSTSPSPKLLLTCALPLVSSNSTRSSSAQPHQQQQQQQHHHHHHRHHGHHGKQRKQIETNTTETSTALTSPTASMPVATSTTTTTTTTLDGGASNVKPKIDIAYLDKRMYAATERVLYPPPRNKRRQSLSALVVSSTTTTSTKTSMSTERKGAIAVNANATTATTSSAAAASANKATKEELDPVWRKIDVNKKFRRPSLSGYKSDGGGGNTTICSKILAAKSGYVSDYGSSFMARSSHHHHSSNHNSGYKSDASCKSRYSVKSCASRRSRAKSCGYRSDCKEAGLHGGQKSTKFRRKRRCSMLFSRASSKLLGAGVGSNPNDDQDILQLAGLSLGQSSEESNEYVCKPNLDSLPSTSVSKKYGEINRFIATGEYFGRGSSGGASSGGASGNGSQSFAGLTAKRLYELNNQDDPSQDGYDGAESNVAAFSALSRNSKLQIPRKQPLPVDEITQQDLLPHTSRKIKSRRSSAASYCSSYYSGVSKIRRRKRRKSFRYPTTVVDSKLLTEIDIMTNTFDTMCRIQANGGSGSGGGSGGGAGNISNANSSSVGAQFAGGVASTEKDKLVSFGSSSNASTDKLQASSLTNAVAVVKRDNARDKRSLKKRKTSENLDFALLSAAVANAAAGSATPSSGGGSSKRRHKKTNSSSPDDHKLPLKKRHYLLTPGEKSAATEAAVAAVAAKLFASNSEAWAAAAAVAKSTVSAKAQQQQFISNVSIGATAAAVATSYGSSIASTTSNATNKGGKTGLTPKKRHLLQNSSEDLQSHHHHHHHHHAHAHGTHVMSSSSSPLRVVVDGVNNSISGGKFLDISPLSLSAGSCSTKHSSTATAVATAAVTGITGAVPAEVVHKKRSRLEGLVTKIATASNVGQPSMSSVPTTDEKGGGGSKEALTKSAQKINATSTSSPQLDSEASCPPPGVFEPSVELEIQNITKISEAAASIITKSEVDSPLLMEISKSFGATGAATKTEGGTRVIETLLNKTGANLILRRKRKKFNRTGFPTVRRKKRKINEQLLLDITPDISEQVQRVIQTKTKEKEKHEKAQSNATNNNINATENCERVPQTGEASNSFVQRANRQPRLSVVSLERLQGVFTTASSTTTTAGTTPDISSRTQTSETPKNKLEQFGTKAQRGKIVTTATTTSNKNKKQKGKEKEKEKEETLADLKIKASKTEKKSHESSSKSSTKSVTNEKITNTKPASRSRGRCSKTPTSTPSSAASVRISTPLKKEIKSIKKPSDTSTTPTAVKKTTAASTKSANSKAPSTAAPRTPSSSSAHTPLSQSTAFTKSSVQKIITAKSLEAKVKLPAGIDPNTNFSCKIRLKRRNALFPQLSTSDGGLTRVTSSSTTSNNDGQTVNVSGETQVLVSVSKTSANSSNSSIRTRPLLCQEEPDRPAAEIDAEAAAKDPNIDYVEHDVLPLDECSFNFMELFDVANAGDTSDEKSSSSGNGSQGRKLTAPIKKNYLPAGLFSNYFKVDTQETNATLESTSSSSHTPQKSRKIDTKEAAKSDNNKETSSKEHENNDVTTQQLSLLPPPAYCERYFRREQRDFQLPYDIYWAYTHNKLPKRNTVPSWQYRKIRTNIYAESVRPNLAGFDHPTCNCKSDSGCGENCLNRMVYTECSPSNCPTREKCLNQKIQRHEVAPGVERFMTTDKGWGVRTKQPIRKGTYILEYVGEVVTEREFKDRMGLIYQNDTHHYCLHLDGGLVIDGHRMGSDGRFVNHSCLPNCEMQKWSVNGLSRMALFAARNIEPGEELTYDYNFSLFNPSEGQPCRCNTAQCRGVIGGKSQRIKPLPVEVKSLNESLNAKESARSGRQRKRKASKNTQRNTQSKDIAVARVQQLSEKEKKLVKQYGIFLVRCFEKIRRCRAQKRHVKKITPSPANSPNGTPTLVGSNASSSSTSTPASITNRRPSTPNSLAAQISAFRSPRSIKTRGLTLAAQDPEVEKMAKMAVIFRDICATLAASAINDENNKSIALLTTALSPPNPPTTPPLTNKNQSATSTENAEATTTVPTVGTAAAVPAAAATAATAVGSHKKKKSLKTLKANAANATFTNTNSCLADFKSLQTNIEQGFYKQPAQFDTDMQKILNQARSNAHDLKAMALAKLLSIYEEQKSMHYKQLLELVEDESALKQFRLVEKAAADGAVEKTTNTANKLIAVDSNEKISVEPTTTATESNSTGATAVVIAPTSSSSLLPITAVGAGVGAGTDATTTTTEDIIRCICGLFKDEGLMIQCARCMVWQHTECTKADINADNYLCERCEPRIVDREIPLEDFTEEGHRYYLTLMRGDLHIRQGDAVYVLRDIPIKDAAGKVVPMKKHTYETIGNIDYNECDIFRVERLWKDDKQGKRFIFGHHFLRPHETFHEPTRRFYPNEVVRVPLYEVVPIELVIGRCWVLDRTTFCKGRPIECNTNDDQHCYICELRVDKSARFFSKAKISYPTCTKSYAFRKFPERLKIAKTYAPHDVDPAMLKTKKQKTEIEIGGGGGNGSGSGSGSVCGSVSVSNNTCRSSSPSVAAANHNNVSNTPNKQDTANTKANQRKRQSSSSPANNGIVHLITPMPLTVQVLKKRRQRLENVLATLKLKSQNTQNQMMLSTEPPLDLSYLLSGRSARQRKTLKNSTTTTVSTTMNQQNSTMSGVV